jgi:hypothetical protein
MNNTETSTEDNKLSAQKNAILQRNNVLHLINMTQGKGEIIVSIEGAVNKDSQCGRDKNYTAMATPFLMYSPVSTQFSINLKWSCSKRSTHV